MQRLRKAAYVFERGLRDVAHVAKFFRPSRSGRRLTLGPAQQGSDGREDFSKFIVQFAKNELHCQFVGENQLMQQIAALLEKVGNLAKNLPVRREQKNASNSDTPQRRRKKQVTLP